MMLTRQPNSSRHNPQGLGCVVLCFWMSWVGWDFSNRHNWVGLKKRQKPPNPTRVHPYCEESIQLFYRFIHIFSFYICSSTYVCVSLWRVFHTLSQISSSEVNQFIYYLRYVVLHLDLVQICVTCFICVKFCKEFFNTLSQIYFLLLVKKTVKSSSILFSDLFFCTVCIPDLIWYLESTLK